MSGPLRPPSANRVDTLREYHGDTFVDPYEWMRDKESRALIAHLEAENAYVDDQLAHLDGLRTAIFGEIKSRTKETDLSIPTRMGQWWYYARSFEGKQYGVHCRCPIGDHNDWMPPTLNHEVPGEQILLDGNAEAEGHDFFSLGAATVSPDGNTLAFSVDVVGHEMYTLRFKDLSTGEMYPDEIADIGAGATWAMDSRTLYYPVIDEAFRPYAIRRYMLGSGEEPVEVFSEPDERFWIGAGRTRSDRFVAISVHSSVTSEILIGDAADPVTTFSPVWLRRNGIEYTIDHIVVGGEDRLLILHNDGAVNFELAELPVSAVADGPADPALARTLVAHRDDVRLDGVEAFAERFVIGYRREALPRIQVWPIGADGYGSPQEVEFDSELMLSGLGDTPEWNSPLLRVGCTSFITPTRVYDLDVHTGHRTLLKEQPVLGGYRREDYVERREWAVAEDGTRIPLSIVHRTDTEEPAPTLLYGYGAYEMCEDPQFSIARLSLLDRGVVFVIAHVRGGGEMGRLWYEDGKMGHKKHSFTDFVAAARHLVDSGVAIPDRLAAWGGSAGGLLVGAAVNLAPELFAGVLAQVPFVDPVTTICDPSLPLTVTEWDEWGNPLEDKDVYDYIKSYSPYENIRATEYPTILAMTSLHDSRVLYVEPAKWVAELRHTTTGDRPILMRTEMTAGHGGISGRYERWKESAFQLAWILDVLGAEGEKADV
ncbi:MAG: S9 family peptidase [Mycobacterium sp.]